MKKPKRREAGEGTMKRYVFDLDYSIRVWGVVYANSTNQAREKIAVCSNPDFDECDSVTMPSEPDIEIDSCYEEDFDE